MGQSRPATAMARSLSGVRITRASARVNAPVGAEVEWTAKGLGFGRQVDPDAPDAPELVFLQAPSAAARKSA